MSFSYSLEMFLSEHERRSVIELYDSDVPLKMPKGSERMRAEERSLIRLLSTFGIDIAVFKKGHTYQINKETAILFVYILDYLNEVYYKEIRKRMWQDIPQDELIRVRTHLIKALYSSGYAQDDVEQIVQKFEMKTNCPSLYSALQLSEFTLDAIEYLKGERPRRFGIKEDTDQEDDSDKVAVDHVEWEMKMMGWTLDENQNANSKFRESFEHLNDNPLEFSKAQWDMIGQHIEHQYRYVWKPQLIGACLKMVENYPQNLCENDDEWVKMQEGLSDV